MPANKPTKTVLIANGAALSGEINLGNHNVAAIIMPATWTAANLTVQAASASGGTYQDVHDDVGAEVSITAAAARAIVVGSVLKQLGQFNFIKLRSGTTGTPVNQAADRTLILVLSDN